MQEYEPYVSIGLALAAGLLIGLEREQSGPEHAPEGALFRGGARTHPLFALVGALAMLIGRQLGILVPGLALAGVLGFLSVGYAADVKRGDAGLTSEAAFLLSFLLGALALTQGVIEPLSHRAVVVSSVAVVATLLLSSKPWLHAFVRKVSKDDLLATLKFLTLSVVVLPLLPDRTVGPLDALNPRQVGFMIVLIAAISFAGYLAVRLLGPSRGLAVTGAAGGLVSSTAVMLSMAARARQDPTLATSCAFAVTLASAIMGLRILAVVSLVNSSLVRLMAPPMLGLSVAGLLAAGFLYLRSRRGRRADHDVPFSNPFELASAIKFGLLFAGVLLASKAAYLHLGTSGAYVAGAVAGTTDVDAITLSMAKLARGQIAPEVATTTIFIAAAANTLVKGGIAIVTGGWVFGRLILAAFGVMLALGGLGLAAAWLL